MTETAIQYDGNTVHAEIKEEKGIRHEYWDKEQYERQENAIGRHPRYVCYTYEGSSRPSTSNNIIDLPKGITNGEVMKILFPKCESYEQDDIVDVYELGKHCVTFDTEWWNSPYRESEK